MKFLTSGHAMEQFLDERVPILGAHVSEHMQASDATRTCSNVPAAAATAAGNKTAC